MKKRSRTTRLRRRLAIATLIAAAIGAATFTTASGKPGEFDYYVLALSWSPAWCAIEGRGKRDPQCRGPRHYAFVLHGLWPQFTRGWPKNCDTGKKPWVPQAVIDGMLDIMPAKGLVIHQYRKHGTCSGLSPGKYYAVARALFERVKIPARYLHPREPVMVSPAQVETDFLKTNSDLRPDMISISCSHKHLREVRICFSRDLAFTACGENESQSRLCQSDRLVMPPVRGG